MKWPWNKKEEVIPPDSTLEDEKKAIQGMIDEARSIVDVSKKRGSEISERESGLRRQELELNELMSSIKERSAELQRLDKEVSNQVRAIDKKTLPSNIWVEAFSEGWNKAWDCMWPLQSDAIIKMKRYIEEQAIQSVLDRKNGHNKTDN